MFKEHVEHRNVSFIISQLKKYIIEFLKDTYPGARSSPALMARLMGTPDIQPDTAIAGE